MAEALNFADGNMQTVVACDTCENTAEHLCKTCHDKLCTRCKNIHRKSRSSFDHEVTQLSFEALSSLTKTHLVCRSHPDLRANVCCGKCDIPVCEQCLIGEHSNHKTISLEALFIEKRRKVSEKYSFLQSELPKYQALLERLEENEQKNDKNREIIENDIASHLKEARQKIDFEENRLLSIARSAHQLESDRLKKQKIRIVEHIEKIQSFVRMYQKEMQYEKYAFILYADFATGSFIPEKVPCFFSTFALHFTKGTLNKNLFVPANKISVRLLHEMLEVEKIEIGTSEVETLTHQINDDTFWVFLAGDVSFKKCNRSGEILVEIRTTANGTLNKPICIIPDGGVILRKSVNGLSQVNEKEEETDFMTFMDRIPICIYMSKQNTEIAVATMNSAITEGKVSKFNTRGQLLNEIKNKVLFRNTIGSNEKGPVKMVENVNGDIYISNKEVDVFDKSGNFRFTYGGGENTTFPFNPRGICADIIGNILIADKENCCIHVLYINGNLQKLYHVSSEKDEFYPISLTIDANHCLCVGGSDGKIRVFKYIE